MISSEYAGLAKEAFRDLILPCLFNSWVDVLFNEGNKNNFSNYYLCNKILQSISQSRLIHYSEKQVVTSLQLHIIRVYCSNFIMNSFFLQYLVLSYERQWKYSQYLSLKSASSKTVLMIKPPHIKKKIIQNQFCIIL